MSKLPIIVPLSGETKLILPVHLKIDWIINNNHCVQMITVIFHTIFTFLLCVLEAQT